MQLQRLSEETLSQQTRKRQSALYITNKNIEDDRNVHLLKKLRVTIKQIFKTTIALSNTEKEANLYGGKDLPYQRAKKGTEHALDKQHCPL